MLAIDPGAPTLTTERLTLRELQLADAQAVSSRAGDRRVAKYLIAVPSPYPITLAARWIAGRIAWWPQGRGVTLAIGRAPVPRRPLALYAGEPIRLERVVEWIEAGLSVARSAER